MEGTVDEPHKWRAWGRGHTVLDVAPHGAQLVPVQRVGEEVVAGTPAHAGGWSRAEAKAHGAINVEVARGGIKCVTTG